MTAETHRWWFGDDDDATTTTSYAREDTQNVVDDPVREISRVVDPGQTRRIGNGGTAQSRSAILHSLASIESWAMLLAWDAIQRFGVARNMPKEFYDDFVELAADEGRHFALLSRRLDECGVVRFGELEAHDGLWRTAKETAHSLEARLAVEHCVHEARGLDVLPQTIGKFRRNGDEASATLLETVIYPEEITHCASGLRWFKYLHAREVDGGDVGEETEESGVVKAFHEIVREYFHGALKPPFNDEARAKAGFTPVWYEPLATKVHAQ
ncbi:predicted protein [Ostreococcus lucimarinus CCE9901]|uniref:Ferritin-like superfamily n=1 Tax=Ostreococcus lucimarinus (strain CCE9901) TaxID=436017 RepID=A4S8F2_OSTLU|nr:predicted protein [Ostreococcus lucimarinus CCE9901]ABP00053.1 predicted protein [Ostreococcus lucimarinus CCE9901]|eukprot:XP_001421759.1 predicted protein [Ostreococcus lucimarinus CCE9901]